MAYSLQQRDTTMANRLLTAIVVVVLGGALSNCGTNNTSTTAAVIPRVSPAAPSVAIPQDRTMLLDATLTGTVYEVVTDSPRQIAGIEGVSIYCEQCGESTHNYAYTDAAGNFRFPHGVWVEPNTTFPIRRTSLLFGTPHVTAVPVPIAVPTGWRFSRFSRPQL